LQASKATAAAAATVSATVGLMQPAEDAEHLLMMHQCRVNGAVAATAGSLEDVDTLAAAINAVGVSESESCAAIASIMLRKKQRKNQKNKKKNKVTAVMFARSASSVEECVGQQQQEWQEQLKATNQPEQPHASPPGNSQQSLVRSDNAYPCTSTAVTATEFGSATANAATVAAEALAAAALAAAATMHPHSSLLVTTGISETFDALRLPPAAQDIPGTSLTGRPSTAGDYVHAWHQSKQCFHSG
jgi:hypothetical protein